MNRLFVWKRTFDIFFSVIILTLTMPVIIFSLLMVFISDFQNPIFASYRVGLKGRNFMMFKIRSMYKEKNLNKNIINSTKLDDPRITKIGTYIRKYKLDELLQFINVLLGKMSIVGPRPNTFKQGVELYTNREMDLLSVKPGITDPSSIIFSDEALLLQDSKDADLQYNKIIRPWKSRFSLWYVENISLKMDIQLCFLTFLSLFNRKLALKKLSKILIKKGQIELGVVCRREEDLKYIEPPI